MPGEDIARIQREEHNGARFPSRQRCKACRKGLGLNGAPVFLGMFDTPRCASMAPLVTDVERAPRNCRTERDGRWVWKKRYRDTGEIRRELFDDPSTSVYTCNHCGHLHVGRTLAKPASGKEFGRAEHRVVMRRSDLADALVKARGQATHKQVGEAIGVRPIRIKEWEDASFDNPSVDVLLKLMRAYRLSLAIVF